jgi:uncharacterized protein (DUF983 family)
VLGFAARSPSNWNDSDVRERFTFACADLAGNRSGRSRKVSRVRSGKVLPEVSASEANCSSCVEHFGKIHADDGPAWLTIIIVGHLVVPSAFCRGQ